jgi:hypothetical protein
MKSCDIEHVVSKERQIVYSTSYSLYYVLTNKPYSIASLPACDASIAAQFFWSYKLCTLLRHLAKQIAGRDTPVLKDELLR